jgi:RimJ/RimL family protein N-acetyltransferase
VTFMVRRLRADDAAIYRDIRLEGLQKEPASFGSSYAAEVDRPLTDVRAQLERNFTFGAFDIEGLCGVMTFYVEAMEKTRHRGHVVGVYMTPRGRGTGASRALMEALIDSARREVLQLHLVVTQDNERARRFYERLGFVIYGSDPRGLRVDGKFYDDYLMVLRLDEGGTESDTNA